MVKVNIRNSDFVAELTSHMKGVKAALHEQAEDIAADAERRLAPHRKTGETHVEVEQGRVDSYISLVAGPGQSAWAIEFGHWESGNRAPEEGENDEWVDGLYIITGAAGIADGKR